MTESNTPKLDRRRLLMAATAVIIPTTLLSACGGGGGSSGGSGGGGGGSSSSSSSSSSSTSVVGNGPFIVVDQFGYQPARIKIAVLRDPVTGFDATDQFTPGTICEVVNATSNAVVFSAAPVAWNSGAVNISSGDRAWQFDFSNVTAAGDYFVRDKQSGVTSPTFSIATDVYAPVLRAAMRYFYYQRASMEKKAAFAGAGWADAISHVGALQDRNARLYSAPSDASTERDLSGGWYDAGDYNRYTSWHATYIINLLHAYIENPGIWADNYNIPESGNGIPDIIDEIRFGLDWLVKMQNTDGSMLSILSVAHASPPSAATGQSLYGSPNTSCALVSAGAFALAAKVFAAQTGAAAFAADLLTRAENAWTWAQANPNVIWKNNDAAYASQGIGAGQQETDDYGRTVYALTSAAYLFDATGKATYRTYVDAHYTEAHLLMWTNASPFEDLVQQALLYYVALPAATSATAAAIRTAYTSGMETTDNWMAVTNKTDPYMAHLGYYGWGSNGTKSAQGVMYAALVHYGLGTRSAATVMDTAAGYIHYLHGVNPLGKAYLSNMAALGAENSVDQFYHTWFNHNNPKWGSVKDSTFGPAPGFLVGGPNPGYNWAAGCPTLNAACGTAAPSPPTGQPDQKSYKDFNDSWPIDSWEVTENSNSYQTAYIRLLAKFLT